MSYMSIVVAELANCVNNLPRFKGKPLPPFELYTLLKTGQIKVVEGDALPVKKGKAKKASVPPATTTTYGATK